MENKETIKTLGDFDPAAVVIRDKVTKAVVRKNPYRMISHEGKRFFEHPVGSGNLWYENREHAGRIEAGKITEGAPHKLYTPSITEDEQLARQLDVTKQENSKLLAELAEIKREQQFTAKPDDKKSEIKKGT